MAWDTKSTRAGLLAAAVEEFSEHGFAGARIERISRRAGINSERIYSYFGNKEHLFQEVLVDQLGAALDETPLEGDGAAAIGLFAGRYFDFTTSHPQLPRLIYWEGLELERPVNLVARSAHASSLVAALGRALPSIDQEAAEDLLLSIVTLCYGWQATPNLTRVITARDPSNRRRRAAIARAAEALAEDALSAFR